MPDFSLRFTQAEIRPLADRYEYEEDAYIEERVAPVVRCRGHYTANELHAVCRWKSPRSAPRALQNGPEFVEEVTRLCLASPIERFRIEGLTVLDGVHWPTASTLLHFGSNDPYPILDFRALWSVGIERPPSYDFPFWWAYVEFCRKSARDAGVSMRTLDRALWQYSKENQSRSG